MVRQRETDCLGVFGENVLHLEFDLTVLILFKAVLRPNLTRLERVEPEPLLTFLSCWFTSTWYNTECWP